MTGVISGGLLALAAVIVAVPAANSRVRLSRLDGTSGTLWPWLLGSFREARRALEHPPPRWTVVTSGGVAGLLGMLWYGPVAGVVAAGYAGLGSQIWLRRRSARAAHRALTDTLDGLTCLVADLRAGLPPAVALDAALPQLIGAGGPAPRHRPGAASVTDLAGHLDHTGRGRLLARLTTAWHTAELTGAPLGEVLERLDAEVRSGERARALATAQAASAQVTALLLGALPLAGVALGYGMGADPLGFLFRTPAGAACAVTALALQLAGLAWTRRLSRVDPTRVDLESVGDLL